MVSECCCSGHDHTQITVVQRLYQGGRDRIALLGSEASSGTGTDLSVALPTQDCEADGARGVGWVVREQHRCSLGFQESLTMLGEPLENLFGPMMRVEHGSVGKILGMACPQQSANAFGRRGCFRNRSGLGKRGAWCGRGKRCDRRCHRFGRKCGGECCSGGQEHGHGHFQGEVRGAKQ